jgi:catechol 2,3-dioxygenase-like lactoylglutathione lyase family enzyme
MHENRLINPRSRVTFSGVEHLALAVADQERSRHFYESYFGFDAQPARQYDDGVLMLYNSAGFALALGPTNEPVTLPAFLHFGIGLPSRDAVLAFRDRLVADGIPIAEEWDKPDYVSVKCLDPDGYVVEAAWEPCE